jgi:hypothetical protein
VSVLVVAQSSSEIPEGLMNNPVYDAKSNTFYLREKFKHLTPLRFFRIKMQNYDINNDGI